jgi:hypothetical protein
MLISYWRFNEADSKLIIDLSNTPTNIDLDVYMEGNAVWQYVDEAFPELTFHDETIVRTVDGSRLRSIAHSRALFGYEVLELASFEVIGEQTLELWVNRLVTISSFQEI